MTSPKISPEENPPDLDAKITAAIDNAVNAAVANGDISSAEDAVVIVQPTGHITVLPKSEAQVIGADSADDEELPPFKLPAMYREDNRESLVDTPYYDQHLASNWGF